MIKLLKKTDFTVLNIEGVKFFFRPKTFKDQLEVGSFIGKDGTTLTENSFKIIEYYLKNLLKKVEGLNFIDGSDFKLEFENDVLTQDCFEAIGTILGNKQFSQAIIAILGDQEANIEGVKIIRPTDNLKTKKKT